MHPIKSYGQLDQLGVRRGLCGLRATHRVRSRQAVFQASLKFIVLLLITAHFLLGIGGVFVSRRRIELFTHVIVFLNRNATLH